MRVGSIAIAAESMRRIGCWAVNVTDKSMLQTHQLSTVVAHIINVSGEGFKLLKFDGQLI